MSTARDLRPTWVEIDREAFSRNVDAIVSRLPDGSRLIAVLKADAYGHGAIELAKRCRPDRVAMIATALLEESLELRRAGIDLPLFLLGPLSEAQIPLALDQKITIGVIGPEALESVCRIARERDVAIHLKLDTGMGRMGVTEQELPRVLEMIRSTPRLRVEASAAALRGLVEPGDYVRVGVALMGAEVVGTRLEPVMRWRTEIMRLKELPPGHGIGYGTTFHTLRPSRIATLPVGYADGYDRKLSNNAYVLVRGRRSPVVGRVSMDLLTIDVTDIPEARFGDEAVLIGDGITAEEIAQRADTISYEVFCRISKRVPRIYK